VIANDLLDQATASHPTLTKTWVDAGFKVKTVEHGAALGVDVEIVTKDPQVKGFSVVKRRWVVERTIGWLMQHRRLARDYEALPANSASMITIAMIDNLARRLPTKPPQPGETPKPHNTTKYVNKTSSQIRMPALDVLEAQKQPAVGLGLPLHSGHLRRQIRIDSGLVAMHPAHRVGLDRALAEKPAVAGFQHAAKSEIDPASGAVGVASTGRALGGGSVA
jgi:hypothetical protein